MTITGYVRCSRVAISLLVSHPGAHSPALSHSCKVRLSSSPTLTHIIGLRALLIMPGDAFQLNAKMSTTKRKLKASSEDGVVEQEEYQRERKIGKLGNAAVESGPSDPESRPPLSQGVHPGTAKFPATSTHIAFALVPIFSDCKYGHDILLWASMPNLQAQCSHCLRERERERDGANLQVVRMRDGSPLIIAVDSYVNLRRVYRCVLHLFALVWLKIWTWHSLVDFPSKVPSRSTQIAFALEKRQREKIQVVIV